MSTALENFIDGFYTYATTADDFLTAVGSRVYFGQASQDTAFPCAVVNILSNVNDDTFSEEKEVITLSIAIYSNPSAGTAAEIMDIYSKLRARFDFAKPTITSWTTIQLEQINTIGPFKDDYGVWSITVDYKATVQGS